MLNVTFQQAKRRIKKKYFKNKTNNNFHACIAYKVMIYMYKSTAANIGICFKCGMHRFSNRNDFDVMTSISF